VPQPLFYAPLWRDGVANCRDYGELTLFGTHISNIYPAGMDAAFLVLTIVAA
jgi:hypothetical protein